MARRTCRWGDGGPDNVGLAVGTDVVIEGTRTSPAAVSAWIDQMRDTDALLTALEPDEIEDGRRALESHNGTLDPLALTLITIRRDVDSAEQPKYPTGE